MIHRVLVKLSGEALKGGEEDSILSEKELGGIAEQISALHAQGIEICIVVGAGNIWRGKLAETLGLDPVKADYMGMLGTEINAIAIAETLKNRGVGSLVLSSIAMKPIAEQYSPDAARSALSAGKVVVFAGGTGNPFFTTDTGAALRAKEMGCDAILMGKNGVEGVYDSDPRKNKDARLLKELTYSEVLEKNLQVMDGTAVSLLRESNIIIRVFNMADPSNIVRAVKDPALGTVIHK